MPILLIVEDYDMPRLIKGLDIGASDYLMKPIDPNELLARVRIQIRRRRYQDRLRAQLRAQPQPGAHRQPHRAL